MNQFITTNKSNLEAIPKNLIIKIISYIPIKEIFINISVINKRFNALINSNYFWKQYSVIIMEYNKSNFRPENARDYFVNCLEEELTPLEKSTFVTHYIYQSKNTGKLQFDTDKALKKLAIFDDGCIKITDFDADKALEKSAIFDDGCIKITDKDKYIIKLNDRDVVQSLSIQDNEIYVILQKGNLLKYNMDCQFLNQKYIENFIFEPSIKTEFVKKTPLFRQKHPLKDNIHLFYFSDKENVFKKIECYSYLYKEGTLFFHKKENGELCWCQETIDGLHESTYFLNESISSTTALTTDANGFIASIMNTGNFPHILIDFHSPKSGDMNKNRTLQLSKGSQLTGQAVFFQSIASLPGKLFVFDAYGAVSMIDVNEERVVWTTSTEHTISQMIHFSYGNNSYLAAHSKNSRKLNFLNVKNGNFIDDLKFCAKESEEVRIFRDNGRCKIVTLEKGGKLKVHTTKLKALPKPQWPQPNASGDLLAHSDEKFSPVRDWKMERQILWEEQQIDGSPPNRKRTMLNSPPKIKKPKQDGD